MRRAQTAIITKHRSRQFVAFAILVMLGIGVILLVASFATQFPQNSNKLEWSREESIPKDAIKVTSENDSLPPMLSSSEWEPPTSLGEPVDTRGAEDSPFITPDGDILFFFFTPDVRKPAQEQLSDGVTGIWYSTKTSDGWSEPRRIVLTGKKELSLDGCPFVQGNVMWFCSARAGSFRGVDMYTAQLTNGAWTNWRNVGEILNVEYGVGELHITSDGKEMYFHSSREGGKGGLDIWVTRMVNGEWQQPENIEAVNTSTDEGWPFVTQDANELWFTQTYNGSPSIFRSKKVGDEWSTAKLIVSQFAAEPSLDNYGNLYFVHHFFKDGRMIEADIYVAYKKQPLQDLKVPNSIEAISCASMISMNAKTESCHRRLKWRLQL